MQKTCIIIAGPTAVGKTDLSIQIASSFSTSIISADSRQCYRELNVGVAKPDKHALDAVNHYFINSHSIHEPVNAADFEKYALQSAEALFKDKDVLVMVGGTGLYINAFAEGMDEIPQVSSEIREQVNQEYHLYGLSWLQDFLTKNDPQYSKTGEMQNPQRMMRAVEVFMATGKSIRSYQQQQKKQRPFRIIKIGLEWPREILYQRINQRVEQMIAEGLEEEVRNLKAYKGLQALQTVGYREWYEGWDQGLGLEWIIDKVKQNTRHYAKRQMTWFKRDQQMEWIQPDCDMAMAIVNKKMKESF